MEVCHNYIHIHNLTPLEGRANLISKRRIHFFMHILHVFNKISQHKIDSLNNNDYKDIRPLALLAEGKRGPFSQKKSRIVSFSEGEDRVSYLKTDRFDICMLADGHGGQTVSEFLSNQLCKLFHCLYRALCYKVFIDNNPTKTDQQVLEPQNGHNSRLSAVRSSQLSLFKRQYDSLNITLKKQIDCISSYCQINLHSDTNIKTIEKLLKLTINYLANEQKANSHGSTLVGFVRTRDYLTTFNVGDSRCYALSISSNRVQLLTQDHNFESRVERKRLNYISNNPSKQKYKRLDGVLAMTRSIGDADVGRVIHKPDICSRPLSNYSVIALVSDGTYEYINNKVFEHIMKQAPYMRNNNDISDSINSACSHSIDDRSHLLYVI